MELQVVPALVAGLAATLVMTALMGAARAMGVTRMPGMPLFIGSMVSPDPSKAKAIGALFHFLVMGTVVFGLLYALLFALLGSAGWVIGALIGLSHGLVVGAMMPMMPAVHPRVTRHVATVGAPAVTVERGTVEVANPGLFGAAWGGMTPMGLVAGHVAYGIVVALVYSALI